MPTINIPNISNDVRNVEAIMKSPTLSNISVDGSEKNDGRPNANIMIIKKDINGK